jgi:hypothetical protein
LYHADAAKNGKEGHIMKKMRKEISIKMSKKIAALVILAAVLVFPGCSSSSGDAENGASWPAMENLKAVSAEDINEVSYTRSTEGGSISNTVTDPTGIEDIYLRLKDVSIESETDEGAEDDGLSLKVKTEDKTFGFEFEGDVLILEDGSRYKVDNLDSLKRYIDGLDAGNDEQTSSVDSASGEYDILSGYDTQTNGSIKYVYGNDFALAMPAGDDWDIEKNASDSFTVYLKAAKEDGYEGDLVTIRAYDPDDDSYMQLPSYHVAGTGKNVNKRFVAIYPTDVRWNHEDASQEARYRELEEHLKKIGEGAANSPFVTGEDK